MANSIKGRVPFLDYKLVEYCLNLLPDSKVKNGWTKYHLRNSNILSNEIAWRKSKLGYDSPGNASDYKFSKHMLSYVLNSPIISKIANKTKINLAWNSLTFNEKWRLFNVAKWQEIHKLVS